MNEGSRYRAAKITVVIIFLLLASVISSTTSVTRLVEANSDPYLQAIDIGAGGNDYAWGVAEYTGGIILAGYTDSYGKNSALVVNLVTSGKLVIVKWEEIIGTSSSDERIYDIGRVGSYYILVGWNKTGTYSSQPLIFQLNSNGDLVMSKRVVLGGGISGWFFRVIPVNESTYFVIGYDTYLDVVVLKLDTSGNIAWSKAYSKSGDYVWLYGSALDREAGILYLAAIEYYGHKTILIAVNSTDGSVLWSKELTIAGSSSYTSMGVSVDQDHNIYVYGFNGTRSSNDGFLVKLDPAGTPLWGVVFGDHRFNEPMDTIVYNHSLYLAGYTTMGSFQGNNSFIAKINDNGSLSWFRIYGSNGDDWFYRVMILGNSLFGIGGSDSFSGNDDIFLVTLTTNGEFYNCNLTEELNSTYIKYRSVDILSTNSPVTVTSMTSTLIDYNATVKRVEMPYMFICIRPSNTLPPLVGGEIITPKPQENNTGTNTITLTLLGASITASLILSSKKKES